MNSEFDYPPMIILAGGFGTRLKGVLNGMPKPLANINGKPFLQHLFENWIEKGFNNFILSLHYEADKIIQFVETNKHGLLKNSKVRYIVEPLPLGTGGAISFIVKNIELGESFFVVNADTWVKDGYSILNKYEENVIGIIKVENTNRYGRIILDNSNLIKKFEEKNEFNISGYINIGVYKFSKSNFIDWDEFPYSLENDLFPRLVKSKKIKGVLIDTEFIDIGIPEDYYKFCKSKQIINESR